MRKKQNVNFHLLPIVKEESVSIQKEVARYLLDISKLIIGGAVITAALDIIPDKIVVIYIWNSGYCNSYRCFYYIINK